MNASVNVLGKSRSTVDLDEWESEFKTVAKLASHEGFPYMIFAPVRAHAHAHQNWSATTYPKAWQENYELKKYLPRNPVRSHTLRTSNAFVWSDLEETLTADECILFHECRASGMANGIVIPIHGPYGQAISVGFACELAEAVRPQVVPVLRDFAFRLFHAQENLDPTQPVQLTRRETQVMQLIAKGMDNLSIADTLQISDNSVEWHLKNIFRKLNVNNRTSAAIMAYKWGLVHV
ncbi:MAG: helix-turn-helix transcriptional regulator [Limnohabitans sp.]